MNKLSLLTAVHCNVAGLKKIYKSVAGDLCPEINWVIKDSGSCLQTRKWIDEINDRNVVFLSECDFGIYNALNSGIPYCYDYYLTCGADDTLYEGSLGHIYKIINTKSNDADLVLFSIVSDKKIMKPGNKKNLAISLSGWVASHSLGCLIKTKLHKRYGLYDESYKILADSKFITLLSLNHVNYLCVPEFISGEFAIGGVSTTHIDQRIYEALRYHNELNYNNIFQILLFILRYTKFFFISRLLYFKGLRSVFGQSFRL